MDSESRKSSNFQGVTVTGEFIQFSHSSMKTICFERGFVVGYVWKRGNCNVLTINNPKFTVAIMA